MSNLNKKHLLATALVILQMGAIVFVFITGPNIPEIPLLLFVQIVGLLLAFWALFTLKLANFRVSPLVKPSANLITHGPYRFIRHPMYTSVIAVCSPLVLESPSYIRIYILLSLYLILWIKLSFEESLLALAFPEYTDYCKHTKKLIPYVI